MTRTRSVLACIVALGAVVALAPAASAATCSVSWTNTSGGSWNTASNWSPAVVPGSVNANDDVCITAPGTYTVTLPASGTTVNSLTLGGTSGTQTLDIAGQSYIYGGETYNSTSLGLNAGGTINAAGEVILDATAGGAFQTGNPSGGNAILTTGAALTNFGQIVSQTPDTAWQTYFSGTLTNESSGSIDVNTGTLTMPPGSSSGIGNTNDWAVTNNGSMTVAAGASLALGTPLGSSATGVFTNNGAVTNNGTITGGVGGAMTWTQSGGSVSGNPVVLQGGSTLADSAGAGQFLFSNASGNLTGTIPAGQTVTVRGETYNYQGNNYSDTSVALGGATPVVNDGTLALDAPGTGNTSGGTTHLTNGTIDNFGTLVSTVEDTSWANHLQVGLVNEPGGTVKLASGNVDQDTGVPTTNHGLVTIAPGAQWALDEGGSFVNASDGTISPQIASASNVGTFNLTSPCCNGPGVVTPGGTLAPTLVGGFVPSANEEFQVLLFNGGQFSGTFASVTGGFTADYAHETTSPAYLGVIYQPASPVVKPPTPPSAHVGSISGKKGKLTVKLSCPTGTLACSKLTITATVTEHLKGKKITAVTARATKKKNVVIASSSVALAAGGAKTLTVKLNRTGSKLLAKYGPLKVLVKVSSGGKTLQTFTVRLPKAGKAAKKKK